MSTATPTRRAWPIVAVLAAIAVITGMLVPISAQAAPVALSGKVITASGTALAGVPISVIGLGGPGAPLATATSMTGGSFTFPSLPAGTYTLRFGATSSTYAQYLGSTASIDSAQFITLADASARQSWITATLALGGKIAGNVKTTAGKALANYTVTALAKDDSGAWAPVRTAKSNSTGSYSLAGLEPGFYKLRTADVASAAPSYAPLYSGPSVTLAGATEIGVAPGGTAAVTFVLGASGKASGVVSGSHGASGIEKLAGVVVTPYRLTGVVGSYNAERLPNTTTTNATGAYSLSGLAPGTYTLGFTPRTSAPLPASGLVYGGGFLGGGASPLTASTFVISQGLAVSGKNMQLTAGGSIFGVIAKSGAAPNLPIGNMVVSVGYIGSSADDVPLASTTTDAAGNYTLDGLPAGDYTVRTGSLTAGDTSWVRAATTVLALGNDESRNRPLWLSKRDPAGLHPLAAHLPQFSPGLGKVGTPASVSPGTWNAGPDVTFSYEWLRDGSPIAGAHSPAYVYAPGDVDKAVSVRISARDFAYGPGDFTTSATAAIVEGDKPKETVPATVSGDFHLGKTLTVTPAAFDVAGVVASYSWIASPSDVKNGKFVGNGRTHVVTAKDLAEGPHLFVIIDYERAGYEKIEQKTISAGTALPGTLTLVAAPKVSASGNTLSVSAGKWSATPSSYTYTWHVAKYPGDPTVVTGKTLSLTGRTKAHITVTVAASRAGYTTASTTRPARTGAAPAASGDLTTLGSKRVGVAISAPALLWTPFPAAVKHQWYYRAGSTWKKISGATNGNYEIPASMLGKSLRVTSTSVAPGFAARTVTSKATSAILQGSAPAISLAPGKGVVTNGPVAVNGKVTVTPGTWVPAQSSYGYRWKYAAMAGGPFTIVPGATKSTFVIPASLEGKQLFVDVMAARTGHATGSTTVALGTVMSGALAVVKAPITSKLGTVYSVSTGTWSPAATAHAYAWYAFDEAGGLVGPLSSNSSFDAAAIGHRPLMVAVTATAPGYAPGDTGLMLVKIGTLVASTPPVIMGPGMVGSPLQASATKWGTDSPTIAHQWQVLKSGAWKNIAGATKASYIPTANMLGTSVRLRMTVSQSSYSSVTVATPARKVTLGAVPQAGLVDDAPSLNTAPRSGEKITVSPGKWSVPSSTFTYRWRASADGVTWATVPGAISKTFTVPHDRLGWRFSVVITASAPGHAQGSTIVTSAPTLEGYLKNTTLPTVTKKNGLLTASPGSWAASATGITYFWQVVSPVTGFGTLVSTTHSYKPVAADAGHYIRVLVQATRAGYEPATALVTGQRGAAVTAVTASSVSGVATAGATLTVTPGTWSNANVQLSYQWLRNGAPISGAVASSYVQVGADVGKKLSVRITAASPGYINGVVVLNRPITLNAVTPTATAAPVISGSQHSESHYTVDETVSASTGTWNVSGLTFAYQWQRSGTAIPGATAKTYTVRAADLGSELTVLVTARRALFGNGTATSAPVSIMHWGGDSLYWSTYLTITGSGALGSPISSSVVKWNMPATETYQWYRYAGGTSTPIPGATGKSYTPTAADGLSSGDQVRLIITAHRAGWGSGEVGSDLISIT